MKMDMVERKMLAAASGFTAIMSVGVSVLLWPQAIMDWELQAAMVFVAYWCLAGVVAASFYGLYCAWKG